MSHCSTAASVCLGHLANDTLQHTKISKQRVAVMVAWPTAEDIRPLDSCGETTTKEKAGKSCHHTPCLDSCVCHCHSSQPVVFTYSRTCGTTNGGFWNIQTKNLFVIRQHFCCLKCSNMLRGKAWADFQGGSCCPRLSITWILLLFSPADSPAFPSLFALPGVICAGKELGERAAETSQSQHCNSSGREQGWSGQQEGAGLPGRCPVNLWAVSETPLREAWGWSDSSSSQFLSPPMWGRFSLNVIISFYRTHSHTQTTTAYFSWRRLPKPPWTWTRSSWPSVSRRSAQISLLHHNTQTSHSSLYNAGQKRLTKHECKPELLLH